MMAILSRIFCHSRQRNELCWGKYQAFLISSSIRYRTLDFTDCMLTYPTFPIVKVLVDPHCGAKGSECGKNAASLEWQAPYKCL